MMQLRAEADMGKMCLFLVSLSSPVIRPWWWHWKTSRAPVIINLLPSIIEKIIQPNSETLAVVQRQFFFLCGKYMSTILIDNRNDCRTICSAAIPFPAWKNPAKLHNKDDFCKPVVNCRTGNRPNQTNTCIKECRWQRIFNRYGVINLSTFFSKLVQLMLLNIRLYYALQLELKWWCLPCDYLSIFCINSVRNCLIWYLLNFMNDYIYL